jgi:hypothetical protein
MLVDGLGLHLVEALDPGQRLWPEPGGVETGPEEPVKGGNAAERAEHRTIHDRRRQNFDRHAAYVVVSFFVAGG